MKLPDINVDLWLFWGGSGVGLFGMLFMLWALFWDRARGRKRCPKCWYDMAGLPGMVCPECGRDARVAKRLRKTRRKWRWAVVALLIAVVGYVTMHGKDVRNGEWVALVPSTAFVFVADPHGTPWVPPSAYPWAMSSGSPAAPQPAIYVGTNGRRWASAPTSPAAPALSFKQALNHGAWDRLTSGRMWEWQRRLWVERWIAANGLKPETWLVVPPRCVAGEGVPVWIERSADSVLGGAEIGIRDQPPREWGKNYYKAGCLPPVALGATTITVPLEFDFGGPNGKYVRDESIPIKAVSEEAMFEAVDSPEASDLVRRALDPRLVGGMGWLVLVTNDRTVRSAWEKIDFGVGFRVRLEIGGRVVARGSVPGAWQDSIRLGWNPMPIESEADTNALQAAPENATIIIDGDPAMCVRSYLRLPFGKRAAAWTGHLECPVRIDMERGTETPTP